MGMDMLVNITNMVWWEIDPTYCIFILSNFKAINPSVLKPEYSTILWWIIPWLLVRWLLAPLGLQQLWYWMRRINSPGDRLNRKMPSYVLGIPIIKIRQSKDRLIFTMEIPILGKVAFNWNGALLWGCFTNVLRALQNILSKFVAY